MNTKNKNGSAPQIVGAFGCKGTRGDNRQKHPVRLLAAWRGKPAHVHLRALYCKVSTKLLLVKEDVE